jgi:hypothetical protein
MTEYQEPETEVFDQIVPEVQQAQLVPYQGTVDSYPRVYNQVQPHSPGLGVLASFFVPGLGSMLNEKVGKGIGILSCHIVSAILCFFLVGFITLPVVWIWGMVAANNDAHAWNRAHGIMS